MVLENLKTAICQYYSALQERTFLLSVLTELGMASGAILTSMSVSHRSRHISSATYNSKPRSFLWFGQRLRKSHRSLMPSLSVDGQMLSALGLLATLLEGL